ncbi:hypothetical protein ASZ90_016833 [hydrocarbon metagenome]|uniref:YkgJ family cysteine cluster protein n=1 Tax=hydrocarbon metagenome TaxID=938273 RepID=A0A0W8EAS1_9ZZZZ
MSIMATFVCTRCGKCCMSLGRHIRIERSISPVQHYVRDAISGEVTLVSIHPDNRALFSEGALEGGCPFLRKGGDAPFTCTIYGMRPRICREFRCRTMVITGPDGEEAGYVKGRRTLVTSDPVLEALWQKIPPGAGDGVIREILGRNSYHAEPLT